MHEVPFENLRGPAAVFDIKDKVANDPNYEITMKDIDDWEEKNGKIPAGAFILVKIFKPKILYSLFQCNTRV